jgi:integrase
MENVTMLEVLETPKLRGKYGKGGIRQLGRDRWQISYYDDHGHRTRKSFKTEARAIKELNRAVTLREAGQLRPRENRIKVDSLAESYKVYAANSAPKSYYWICLVWRVHLEPFFGGMLAARVDSDKIQAYIRARLDDKAATSTVNRELTVLRAIFNQASKLDRIDRVPRFPERLREPNPRAGFVNDEQYRVLLSKCKYAWLRAALSVAYNFGFRKSELLSLKVSQIDLAAKTIRLLPGTTKNDLGRVVVMTQEVFALICECIKDKAPGEAVFTWANGNPVADFRRTWRTLVKNAGMSGLHLHDMRRSAIRNMVRAGVSKHVAKRISGHTTDSIFDRYDITDETDLAEATRKMEARIGHKLDT